ncbi:hypothetical protein RD110_01635 [Rhodoferax koreense]|uniref:Endoribonuclease L-PSP/chorismate mutase-like domain-containing protein n=1 Tax=Rhodoferax koreensis TaxID=1842727 RepID=A0A1P8JQM9_9BURK|nr:RidA family protein [Rhodoferax koreense]APW36066.1 hypothetical protein RD110_01635 [Rhodoferax koreense]
MTISRNTLLAQAAESVGFDLSEEIRIGGNYTPAIVHAGTAFVSGQVPRIGSAVAVTGRVGAEVTLAQAQHAARICCVRTLAILRDALGGLDAIAQALRMTVYVQSAADFTQQSEVADAASELLHQVLGAAGRHARTSVGVMQLPKGAAVEVDLIVAVDS